ncbi:hypothetical protein N7456_006780 [Penicillium angulare]|uniref:Uncharacterized protein n=1 Tax=Penicillium angulare TaxID=116970 RepID=A0A9W9FII5_9EURO|nr:hypothetical protein N7456_006780 [Penicillium angulare]
MKFSALVTLASCFVTLSTAAPFPDTSVDLGGVGMEVRRDTDLDANNIPIVSTRTTDFVDKLPVNVDVTAPVLPRGDGLKIATSDIPIIGKVADVVDKLPIDINFSAPVVPDLNQI